MGFDYSDVYVAACGQPFSSYGSGRSHEATCERCHAEINGEPEDCDEEHSFDEFFGRVSALLKQSGYSGGFNCEIERWDYCHRGDVGRPDPVEYEVWLVETKTRVKGDSPDDVIGKLKEFIASHSSECV